MDGLLNTCHASLINIQSSRSRKSLLSRPPSPPPPPLLSSRGEARRGEASRQVESRLIFIDYRVRPRWHLHRPGTIGELEFVMARRGSREILEYNELLLPRDRLLLENRTKCRCWCRSEEHGRIYTAAKNCGRFELDLFDQRPTSCIYY